MNIVFDLTVEEVALLTKLAGKEDPAVFAGRIGTKTLRSELSRLVEEAKERSVTVVLKAYAEADPASKAAALAALGVKSEDGEIKPQVAAEPVIPAIVLRG